VRPTLAGKTHLRQRHAKQQDDPPHLDESALFPGGHSVRAVAARRKHH
jgi:hypothetical protein